MGPRPRGARKEPPCPLHGRAKTGLQWGRARGGRGKTGGVAGYTAGELRLQWGRARGGRGKDTFGADMRLTSLRFNGAAPAGGAESGLAGEAAGLMVALRWCRARGGRGK